MFLSMKRGLELEADAIWEYCQIKRVNHYPCGFVIHPDSPWLGASPDGLIFDPSEPYQFGLIEMKCPNVKTLRWLPISPNEVRKTGAKTNTQLLLAGATRADANYRNALVWFCSVSWGKRIHSENLQRHWCYWCYQRESRVSLFLRLLAEMSASGLGKCF